MSKLAKQVDAYVYGYQGLEGLTGEIIATFQIEQNQNKIPAELKELATHWERRFLRIIKEVDDER